MSTEISSNPDWEIFGPPSIPSNTRPVTAEDEWQQLVELLRNSPLTPPEIMKELRSRGFTTEQIQDVMDELSPEDDPVMDVYLQKLDELAGKRGKGQSANNVNNAKSAKVPNSRINDMLDVATAPRIPEEVYQNLPKLISSRASLITEDYRRDVFLTALLPVLASHMPNVLTAHADGYYSPDIFTLIVAGPGEGKGIASKAKKMASPLNEHLIKESKAEYDNWKQLPKEARERLSEPQPRVLFIPGNSSSRALYDTMEGNGGSGLLFENEIDTLLAASGQEWGNFSDIVRKAFHHESISINRKGERFYIHHPRLSICITGTYDQFENMFRSADNGHFSRYALYTFNPPREWKSHRPTSDSRQFDDSLVTAGERLFSMYRQLNSRDEPLYIDLEPDQWQMIDDTFSEKMEVIEELELSSYLHASNNRTAVVSLRIASMLTVLRSFEEGIDLSVVKSITPSLEDMTAALWLGDTFIQHAFRLYHLLPDIKDTDSKGERYSQFMLALPEEFKTAEAMEIARNMDISVRTAQRWIGGLTRISHGHYRK